MQVFRDGDSLRQTLLSIRQQGKRIGFVPTMGNLHQGHLALVSQAKESCDYVVASIFVNPLQFGLNEDWDQYPRTLESDIEKLTSVGCDYLFTPSDSDIYPNGMADQTRVIVPTMTEKHCGASRPGHFEGVTTIVTKLFNIVQPDEAVFGLKDYQQLAVIRRMVADLCMPVTVTPGAIVREADGLAMSSRNSFLGLDERVRATVLYTTLVWLKEQVLTASLPLLELESQGKALIEQAGFKLDYLQICDAHSLEPAADSQDIVILGAMFAENTRLIDNVTLSTPSLQ